MKEWKPVVGYEDYYLVSNEGDVFSIRSNHLLKVTTQSNGYKRVELNVNGKATKESIHRLVAKAFIPNPNDYPIINHKDENPSNNHADNLEWCTYKYNTNYGNCISRMVANKEYKYGADNPRSKTVYQFDLEGNLIDMFSSTYDAARFYDIDAKSIAKCCTGGLKQYAGYGWSYDKTFSYEKRRSYGFKKGAIAMYDMQGNLIKTYHNSIELDNDGLKQVAVNRVCRGERNSYKGYVFKHID